MTSKIIKTANKKNYKIKSSSLKIPRGHFIVKFDFESIDESLESHCGDTMLNAKGAARLTLRSVNQAIAFGVEEYNKEAHGRSTFEVIDSRLRVIATWIKPE